MLQVPPHGFHRLRHFGFLANRVGPVALLRLGLLGMLGGGALIWADLSDGSSLLGLALMGLAAAPIFPALIGVTPRRLGPEHAASIIGFQVGAASLGGALRWLLGPNAGDPYER